MRLLFVGDIFGKPGRHILQRAVPAVSRAYDVDLVVANVENAAGGFGITRETAQEILAAGVAVMTTGNHVWDKREAMEYIAQEPRLLRPANYPAAAPGRGVATVPARGGVPVGVINVMGRVHMPLVDDPFSTVRRAVDDLRAASPVVLVDFHAEATSEKVAMGRFLDGVVTAVVGTHTHVQTADERVLPGGTAYISDVGMTGPHDSVIGVDTASALARFTTGLPNRFETATGDVRLQAVVIDVDPSTGRSLGIERLSLDVGAIEALNTLTAAGR
jgi:metallophosphoesterase (TIGR00282 family)